MSCTNKYREFNLEFFLAKFNEIYQSIYKFLTTVKCKKDKLMISLFYLSVITINSKNIDIPANGTTPLIAIHLTRNKRLFSLA